MRKLLVDPKDHELSAVVFQNSPYGKTFKVTLKLPGMVEAKNIEFTENQAKQLGTWLQDAVVQNMRARNKK